MRAWARAVCMLALLVSGSGCSTTPSERVETSELELATNEQQKLSVPDAELASQIGSALAISGNTALLGVPFDDVGTKRDQGSVGVFTRPPGVGSLWNLKQHLFAAGGGSVQQFFGQKVGISGDSLLLTAPGTRPLPNNSLGSFFVYQLAGSTYEFRQQVVPQSPTPSEIFGTDLAVSGDTALVAGSVVHVFVRNGSTWQEQPSIPRSTARLALSGDTALIDGTFAGMMVGESDVGRGLLIVFSDGVDTTSWLTADRVLDAARRSDIVVYGVVVQSRNKPEFVRELTSATGGRLYEVERTAALDKVFVQVLEEFRQRYLVSYTPRGVEPTAWHRLTVSIKGRKASVRARPGYLAGPVSAPETLQPR